MTTVWTSITKPTGNPWTGVPNAVYSSVASFSGGEPIGLLMALTYAETVVVTTDPWTKVDKPTGDPWTSIPKAT